MWRNSGDEDAPDFMRYFVRCAGAEARLVAAFILLSELLFLLLFS